MDKLSEKLKTDFKGEMDKSAEEVDKNFMNFRKASEVRFSGIFFTNFVF